MNRNLKVLAGLLFVPLALLVLMGAGGAPLSTVTDATTRLADGYRITTISWIADSTGAVTSTASTAFIRGIIYQFITNPDTSRYPVVADSSGRSPTDNYDITLTNTDGIDVAGGSLMNRDTTSTELTSPWIKYPNTSAYSDSLRVPFINNSKLTTAVTNNKINNAHGSILIYWQEK
jgi:hypothetical protein